MSKTGKTAALVQPEPARPEIDGEVKALLGREAEIEAATRKEQGALSLEYDTELRRLWKLHIGKRKYPGHVLACQEVSALADATLAFQERARVILRKQDRELGNVRAALHRRAAMPEVVVPCLLVVEKRFWVTTSTHTYSSQGFGAEKYARESAELKTVKAQMYGLTPEVRRVQERQHTDQFGHRIVNCEFEVWVNTTEDGVVLLNLKPDISTREFVKACWKKQVNPRVYMPMLPAGYEEEEGLDHWGGERGVKGAQA